MLCEEWKVGQSPALTMSTVANMVAHAGMARRAQGASPLRGTGVCGRFGGRLGRDGVRVQLGRRNRC